MLQCLLPVKSTPGSFRQRSEQQGSHSHRQLQTSCATLSSGQILTSLPDNPQAQASSTHSPSTASSRSKAVPHPPVTEVLQLEGALDSQSAAQALTGVLREACRSAIRDIAAEQDCASCRPLQRAAVPSGMASLHTRSAAGPARPACCPAQPVGVCSQGATGRY